MRPLTIAQVYGAVVGLALVVFGGLGFTENSTFDEAQFAFDFTGDPVHGDLFLGIEVNGPLNILIIALGAVLLVGALRARTARTAAGLVGAIAAVFSTLGWIDTKNVFDTFPTNVPTNVAAAVLAVTGALMALQGIGGRRLRRPERQAGRHTDAVERESRIVRASDATQKSTAAEQERPAERERRPETAGRRSTS